MTANPILLQKKYSRVIECFAKRQGISLDEALGFFYHSEVYKLVCDGVSDMHCMSDLYLAEELKDEYNNKIFGLPNNFCYCNPLSYMKKRAKPISDPARLLYLFYSIMTTTYASFRFMICLSQLFYNW